MVVLLPPLPQFQSWRTMFVFSSLAFPCFNVAIGGTGVRWPESRSEFKFRKSLGGLTFEVLHQTYTRTLPTCTLDVRKCWVTVASKIPSPEEDHFLSVFVSCHCHISRKMSRVMPVSVASLVQPCCVLNVHVFLELTLDCHQTTYKTTIRQL